MIFSPKTLKIIISFISSLTRLMLIISLEGLGKIEKELDFSELIFVRFPLYVMLIHVLSAGSETG